VAEPSSRVDTRSKVKQAAMHTGTETRLRGFTNGLAVLRRVIGAQELRPGGT
jgi:hypothetical protein